MDVCIFDRPKALPRRLLSPTCDLAAVPIPKPRTPLGKLNEGSSTPPVPKPRLSLILSTPSPRPVKRKTDDEAKEDEISGNICYEGCNSLQTSPPQHHPSNIMQHLETANLNGNSAFWPANQTVIYHDFQSNNLKSSKDNQFYRLKRRRVDHEPYKLNCSIL